MIKKLIVLLFTCLLMNCEESNDLSKIKRGLKSQRTVSSNCCQNNLVTQVFFEEQIKQPDLNQSATTGNSMYKIVLPGRYYVAADLSFIPTQTGVIGIEIAASNVILDFNSKTLKQISNNSASPFYLIQIDPGVSNVTIMNGKLISDGINLATAIKIQKIANNINVNNLEINKCTGGGIIEEELNIQSNGLTVSNVQVTESNGNSSNAGIAISITSRSNIDINNSTFNNNINTTQSIIPIIIGGSSNIKLTNLDTSFNFSQSGVFIGYSLSTCRNMELTNCSTSTSQTFTEGLLTFGAGISITDCFDITMKNCEVKNIFAPICEGINILTTDGIKMNSCRVASLSGTFVNGFSLTTTGAQLYKCEAVNISSSGDVFPGSTVGFSIVNGKRNSLFECRAQDNICSNGFCAGFATSGNNLGDTANNKFDKCLAISNNGQSSSTGFTLFNDLKTEIRDCESSFNSSTNGAGSGITLSSCQDCVIIGNCLHDNSGISQYGIKDFTMPTKSWFAKNISYGHGDITSAISADGKSIVDSSGNTPLKHNYLFSLKYEQVSDLIRETSSENMSTFSTTDIWHNLSVFRKD